MSYILDALKKSEQQRQAVDASDKTNLVDGQVAAAPVSSLNSIEPIAIARDSQKYFWMLVLLITLCIGLIGTVLFQSFFQRDDKNSTPLIEPEPRVLFSDNGTPQFLAPVDPAIGKKMALQSANISQAEEQVLADQEDLTAADNINRVAGEAENSDDALSAESRANASSRIADSGITQAKMPANTESNNANDPDVSTRTLNDSQTTGNSELTSLARTVTDQNITDPNIAALLASGSVILPSSKSQLTQAQQQEMIQKAVQGDVDLSTYADVPDIDSDVFVALTDDDLVESNLSNMASPALVDRRVGAAVAADDSTSSSLLAGTANASLIATSEQPVVKLSATPSESSDASAMTDTRSEDDRQFADQGAIEQPITAVTAPSKIASVAPLTPQRAATPVISQPRYETGKAPLSVLAKIPNITVTGHLYSSSPDRRSVTFNRRVYDEGDTVTKDVVLVEITRSGFNLAVDNYLVPIKRGRGWRAVSAD